MRTTQTRTTQTVVRYGLTVAALALPFAPASPAAAVDDDGLTVTATGTTVRLTTSACANGGNAALLASGQADFAQGRQASLADADGTRSTVWSAVDPGSYTVIVHCSNGSAGGTGTVTVAGTPTISATSSPSASATSPSASASASPTTTSPALGVQGGYGGGSRDYGPLTLAGGGVLVVAAVGGGTWYLRRRRAHRAA